LFCFHQIDALISERARRISEYASKERQSKKVVESEYEEDVLAYRARHEPPRKQHRKDQSSNRSSRVQPNHPQIQSHRRPSDKYPTPYALVHPKSELTMFLSFFNDLKPNMQ